ncbi:MAG TPA: ATP-binding protein [Gemmatimonadales bacterium]|nr:ATP-binding protein [Gemmatimonadales bacterium]
MTKPSPILQQPIPVPGPERPRSAPRLAAILGWYVLAAGLLSFMGWVLDLPRLATWGGGISIQPNTALAAAAAGAGLALLAHGFRRPVMALAIVCGLIGFLTLLEHATGIDLGIDNRLTFGRSWGATATTAPGRMGLPASLSWSLLGVGLVATLGGRRARQTAAFLGLTALAVGTLSFIGYLFGANPLYAVARFTGIALQTATMIVAVGIGLVAALPESQPMRTFLEPSGAGLLARRALPFVIAVPLVLGLMFVHGRRAELFDRGLGIALLVLGLIIAMSGVLWWCVRALSARERALEAAEEQLRQGAKMEAIGRLAGGVAHDFNNQLSAVGGFAAFAARDPGIGAGARRDLEEILKAVDRMAGLTRQLLAFSRQQVLQPETLELNAAIVDGSALLERLIGSHIEIGLDLTPDPTWVRVDRAQLLQVLMNLAINARDAMPGGGRLGIRTRRVEVTGREPSRVADPSPFGHYVQLSVSDTGLGIRPEHLPHVFEPFFTTKEQGQGTGLGLATVHGIVTQSQGRISVESRPGAGAEFTVLFPAVSGPPAVVAMPASRAAVPSRPARLLVVDDEDAVRAVVSRALEEAGYEVSQARDGRDALDCLARNGRVDAVLTDVVMPQLGGRELVRRLAGEFPDLPVIWMSGYPRDTAFGDGAPTGAHPFLQKPIPQDVLVRTVAGVVGARKPLSR